MSYEFIIFEKESNDIGVLYLNRPKVLNALNWETLRELRNFLEDDLPKEELKALIVTGAGDRSFDSFSKIINS